MFIPLIFELDIYLRHMKFFRFFSLMAAITQLVLYFGFMITWIVEIYYPPAWLVWGPITVFGNLFISYNLLFDVLNVPISIEIILKEFTLEFF